MKFGIRKIALLIASLSLSACKHLADPPEHWLCQYNGEPVAFYCVNSVTKQKLKIPANSPDMKAAQCLSADDYRNMQTYVDYLIQEAKRRCE